MALGDTLKTLAQRVYGNAELWYVIASANALKDDSSLSVGMTLKTPDIKTVKNDSSTFRPYNPAEIVGDTTPSLPYIPPVPTCSVAATVVRILAVVIACFFPPLAPLAAAAVAGMGELVAQSFEIDEGMREGYDVGAIGASAIMAGFGAKFGPVGGGNFGQRFLSGAIQAVESRAISYGINRALGREDHWNWRSVAVSAVASGLGNGVFGASKTVPGTRTAVAGAAQTSGKFTWGQAAKIAVQAVGRAAISYGVEKAITGEGHWNWRQVAGNVASDVAVGWAQSFAASRANDSGVEKEGEPVYKTDVGKEPEAATVTADGVVSSRELSIDSSYEAKYGSVRYLVAPEDEVGAAAASPAFSRLEILEGDDPAAEEASMRMEEKWLLESGPLTPEETARLAELRRKLAPAALDIGVVYGRDPTPAERAEASNLRKDQSGNGWNKVADAVNGLGDDVERWIDRSVFGQAIQGTWLHDRMKASRTRLPHFSADGIRDAVSPTGAQLVARGKPGSALENAGGYYLGAWNGFTRLTNGIIGMTPLAMGYQGVTGETLGLREVDIPDRMLVGATAGAFVFDSASLLLAPEARVLGFGKATPVVTAEAQAVRVADGIVLRAELKAGMNAKEFERKINRLQKAVDNGELTSNIPHTITDAERRSLTRKYRNDVVDRIEKFYANNSVAKENALKRLRNSDIDHVRDLQLNGKNVRSNLKSLDSRVNQELGRQFSSQLPRGLQQKIIRIDVEGYP